MHCSRYSVVGIVSFLMLPCISSLSAQILFQDGFASAANWSVAAGPDTLATFGYNYANDAIPQAPNGTDRIGLKLEANLVDPPAVDEIAVFPSTFTPSGDYRLRVDMWGNYGVGSGVTTEFPGAFIGHNGTTPGRNGAGLLYSTDGGSSRDYRMYKDATEQFISSGQYNPLLTTDMGGNPICDPALPAVEDCRNGASNFFFNNIPGFDVGFGLDPDDGQGPTQVGFQAEGVGGFQWMTMQIDVFPTRVGVGTTSSPGVAEITLLVHSDPANPLVPPRELFIGAVDNSNGGTVVNMTGKPAVVYADLFSSVSDTPAFSFGIFDNFVVERLGVISGDFNGDGLYSCLDVDALVGVIAAMSNNLAYDLTGNGVVDIADLDAWRAEAGAENIGPGKVYLPGDANLSGSVDGSDFGIWNANKFTTVAAWCSGDFNATGAVDGSDFGIWNANKFTSSDIAAVPEPGWHFWLAAALPLALPRRR